MCYFLEILNDTWDIYSKRVGYCSDTQELLTSGLKIIEFMTLGHGYGISIVVFSICVRNAIKEP